MDELAQRAMLGDWKAQEELTQKYELLRCPHCFCKARITVGNGVSVVCPNCGADVFTEGDYRQVKSRYCPNCGAKMDLED